MKRYSLWWDTIHPDFSYQTQLPNNADIIIIGAGFAGISTAYWLSHFLENKKPKIIIVDEAPHAAFKSSGRMNGSAYIGSNLLPSMMVNALGEDVAKKLYYYGVANNILLSNVLTNFQSHSEFNGGLRVSSTTKEANDLEDSKDFLLKIGLSAKIFNAEQTQHLAIMPFAKNSLFIPGEGLFNPFSLINNMARELRNKNTWIVYGAQIVEASNTLLNNKPYIRLKNGHSITAEKIIHSTTHTIPKSLKINYTREAALSTEPLMDDLDDMPLPLMPIEFNNGLDSARIYNRMIIMTGGK